MDLLLIGHNFKLIFVNSNAEIEFFASGEGEGFPLFLAPGAGEEAVEDDFAFTEASIDVKGNASEVLIDGGWTREKVDLEARGTLVDAAVNEEGLTRL